MRRLLVVAVLAGCVGAGVQIASDDETRHDRQVADVAPFPRTTTPLPVPEVSIVQGPWQDEVPWGAPPIDAEGFVARCTASSSPPCALASRRTSD